MAKRILVVGAVAAGPKAACRARRLMPEDHIILIDQDDLISYGGCGIPYFVSGDVSDEKELRSTSFHMLRDNTFFQDAKGLEVRTLTRVVAIDRARKELHIEDVKSGARSTLPYDKLVLATGSRPCALPIPGNDLDGVFSISSLHAAIALKDRLASGEVGRAVVIGGGAIGIEMAEALADLWGVETTIVEYMPQLLPRVVDRTLASIVQQHLREHGVVVHTAECAREFLGDGQGRVRRVVTDKREIEADLVLVAAGVRPRGELARDAGLLVSPQGAILVDRRMQTSDPDIYAAGDCVETFHRISGKKAYAPMGSVANRQGRVVADNLAGIPSTFDGVVGSYIMKVFDMCVGTAGLTLEGALAEGFDAVGAFTVQSDRAHFFPSQSLMFLHLVADRTTRRVLGVQGAGVMGDGLLARINAAAALLERGAVIEEFSKLEMAYAPPFSTAVDILNAVANVADNLVSGRLRTLPMEDFLEWMGGRVEHPRWLVLDVRQPKATRPFTEKFPPDRWLAIPYDKVRSEYHRIPFERRLVLVCNAGFTSYETQCFLDSVGMGDTVVLPGGLNVVRKLGVDWWPVSVP